MLLGATVVGCSNNASPGSVPYTQPGDAGGMLRDAGAAQVDSSEVAPATTDAEADTFYRLDDSGCVEVDLSTFNKSCEYPSDCTLIPNRFCPGFACPHAIINRADLARFNQVYSHIPPNPMGLDAGCAEYGSLQPACLQGTCAYTQSFGP